MTARESAVDELMHGFERTASRTLASGGELVGYYVRVEEWRRFRAAVLAALDSAPQPPLGDDERAVLAACDTAEKYRRETVTLDVARVRAILTARAHQPTPPDDAGERDYDGHLIGDDGLVEGPGGQRLKPVEDPWPSINAQRQQDGGA